MKLLFHPDAECEFHEGIRQYLLIDPALGADFEAKVEEAVAPVAGLALGVGDCIDDDVIVEFFEDDVEGEGAQTNRIRRTLTSVCERPLRRQPA